MDSVNIISMIDQLERVRVLINDSEDILQAIRDNASLEGKKQINETIAYLRGAVDRVITLEESIV